MGQGIGVIRTVLLAAVLGIGIGACGTACACEPLPGSPVDGVVVEVDAAGLADINGFRLRVPGASTDMQFTMGPLENATQFAPGHLKEHQATGTTIRVFFSRSSTGQLIVYRLEDSPGSSSNP